MILDLPIPFGTIDSTLVKTLYSTQTENDNTRNKSNPANIIKV